MGSNQTHAPKPARAARFVRGFVGVTLSTLLALLVLEVGLRLWQPANLRLFPRFHEAVSYGDYVLRRTRPDTRFVHSSVDGNWSFAINRQGFRDDHDYRFAPAPGVHRVLVLGDSQAMGYENAREDALPAQLEKQLEQRRVRAEVLNGGVAGFGTAESMVFLEQSGLGYQPDAVVLMFYRNDYSDNVRSGLFGLEGSRLTEKARTYAPGTSVLGLINAYAPMRWLSQHSYVYSLVFNAVWNGVKNHYIRSSLSPSEPVVSLVTTVPNTQQRLAEAIVLRIAENLRRRDIAFVVVDVPEMPLDRDVQSFRPSIEPASLQRLRAAGVTVLSSEMILARFRGKRIFRRPHGEQHVSPFVHRMLARTTAAALAPSSRTPGQATSSHLNP